jgi:hypothetical protein
MVYSEAQQYFIGELRTFFTMGEVPASGSSYSLNAHLGDDELWQDLRLGINYYNTIPPQNDIVSFQRLYSANIQQQQASGAVEAPELETADSILMTPVIMCSAFFTGVRIQWFEAGKHFRYNDNGISLERNKQQDYANIVASNIINYLTNTLPLIKQVSAMKKTRIMGSFSGMVGMPRGLTRGLRGTRLGFNR